jgi:hypothetical protein
LHKTLTIGVIGLLEPTYEKLDKVLMDNDLKSKFPIVSARALPRIVGMLVHAPILLTTGLSRPPSPHKFKFELGWLQQDGFLDMVKKVWVRMAILPMGTGTRGYCTHMGRVWIHFYAHGWYPYHAR